MGQEWARRQPYRVVYLNPHSKRASGGQQLVMGQHLRLMRREPGWERWEKKVCHRDVRVLSPEPVPL